MVTPTDQELLEFPPNVLVKPCRKYIVDVEKTKAYLFGILGLLLFFLGCLWFFLTEFPGNLFVAILANFVLFALGGICIVMSGAAAETIRVFDCSQDKQLPQPTFEARLGWVCAGVLLCGVGWFLICLSVDPTIWWLSRVGIALLILAVMTLFIFGGVGQRYLLWRYKVLQPDGGPDVFRYMKQVT
ncbi:MAG: hypothetical protein KKA90_00655 [Nanoarchaeota archaeon]|nr:hypothetical protein [Nanoarchaeota archaeon]